MTLTLRWPDEDLPAIREQQITLLKSSISRDEVRSRFHMYSRNCFVYYKLDWYLEHRQDFLGLV